MIKAIGLTAILVFSVCFGISLSEKERKERAICGELLEFFEYLTKEVSRKRPVNDIVCDFFSCGRKKHIRAETKEELLSALDCHSFTGTAGELSERSAAFIKALGTGTSAELEYESCVSFLKHAEVLCERYRSESGRRGDLCAKLGFMCGIALCILVI